MVDLEGIHVAPINGPLLAENAEIIYVYTHKTMENIVFMPPKKKKNKPMKK